MRNPTTLRLVAYAAMVILGTSAVLYVIFYSGLQGMSNQNAVLQTGSKAEQLCSRSEAASNDYVAEFKIPIDCSLPVGIAADTEGKVWFASTRPGSITMFDPITMDYQEFRIPEWPRGEASSGGSQVWRLRFDSEGNLWFTDEKQNAIWRFFTSSEKFEKYLVPAKADNFSTIYPVDIDFDRSGNPYFVGIRSKELWIVDKSLLQDNTSQGISSVSIPTGGFQGISPSLVSVGSLAVDRQRDAVWLSVLAYNVKGQLVKYDIGTQEFSVYELPENLKSPLGLLLDKSRNLWVTNHGTSIFFKFDTSTGQFTQYSTSPISTKVFGGKQIDAYTLPYWISSDSTGSIWFNEHIGNKIARFDPSKETLIEYWIPTQNPAYSQCADIAPGTECGIANALQFTMDPSSNAWFTEWTENKIGVVSADKPIPIDIKTSNEILTVKRGESKTLTIEIQSAIQLDSDVNLIVAGTFTSTGGLGNTTAIFDQYALSFDAPSSKEVTLVVTPASDIPAGKYTLMVGAEYGNITVNKAVMMDVIQ